MNFALYLIVLVYFETPPRGHRGGQPELLRKKRECCSMLVPPKKEKLYSAPRWQEWMRKLPIEFYLPYACYSPLPLQVSSLGELRVATWLWISSRIFKLLRILYGLKLYELQWENVGLLIFLNRWSMGNLDVFVSRGRILVYIPSFFWFSRYIVF